MAPRIIGMDIEINGEVPYDDSEVDIEFLIFAVHCKY
jgi:hypothetical protein